MSFTPYRSMTMKVKRSVARLLLSSLLSSTVLFGVEHSAAQAQITPASHDANTIVTPNGNTFDITGGTTTGTNLFHSFQTFGLNADQIANFRANPAIQNILGRVVGGDASVINGLIQVTGSNANLYLMNPAGIVFGTNARLDVAGSFTATTANGIGFGNRWFNAIGSNDYANLIGNPGSFAFTMNQPGNIINAGNLSVNAGQSITLLGGTVISTGTLTAPGGTITVAAIPGETFVRISQDGSLLNLVLPVDTGTAIKALPFTPLTLPQLLTGGNLGNATGVAVENGAVKLTGSGVTVPTESGTTIVSNAVDVSGTSGGTINILGGKVGLVNANLNASGTTGGGTVLIGGDYQGNGTVPNAQQTYVSRDSAINVATGQTGNAGKAIVWADQTTRFYGAINARGGTQAGDGGFVEVSGKESLSFDGRVDLSAPGGSQGQLLLDPRSVYICEPATCFTPDGFDVNADAQLVDRQILMDEGAPAANFLIAPATVATALNTGDVFIAARRDIVVRDPITVTGNTNDLTLTAPTVDIQAAITLAGGRLTLSAADSTPGFTDYTADRVRVAANIQSNGGSVTLNAASSNATVTPQIELDGSGFERSIRSGGGNITFNAPVVVDGLWVVDSLETATTVLPGNIRFNSTIERNGGTPANLRLAAKGDVTVVGAIGSSVNPMENFSIVAPTSVGALLFDGARNVSLGQYTGAAIRVLASENITFNGTEALSLTGSLRAGGAIQITTPGDLTLNALVLANTVELAGQDITLNGTFIDNNIFNSSNASITRLIAQGGITLTDGIDSSGANARTEIGSRTVVLQANNGIFVRNTDLTNTSSTLGQSIGVRSILGSIAIEGSKLASAGAVTVQAATNLAVQSSTVRSQQTIQLQAGNTLEVRDAAAPAIVQAAGNIAVQGNVVTIQSLDQPQSAFNAGGNLTLRGNTITANGRFLSAGNLSFLNLAGNPGSLSFTPVDSTGVISAAGDVIFNTYSGPSLKIEARGSIRGGDITITTPNVGLQGSDPEIALLSTLPAVILRAGLGNVQNDPSIQPRANSGLRNAPNLSSAGRTVSSTVFTSTDTPTAPATIQVGTITTASNGPIIISAPGSVTTGGINSPADPAAFGIGQGSVTIASGGNITVANVAGNALVPANISTDGQPVTLSASGNILTGRINTNGNAQNGTVNLSSGGDVQVSTIRTGAGGAINVTAAHAFRAIGDGLGVDSFPSGGIYNDPSLISFLEQRGFSSEQLRNAKFSATGQFGKPLSGTGVAIVDSSLRSYSLAVNITSATPDVPVINIRVGNAQQEIVNQLIGDRGRVVILGDSHQSFRVGPVPNDGLVFVPASPSDSLENYNPATNNFGFKWNAAQPLTYPSELFPLNASGIAGAIAVDDGTNEKLLSSLQYRSFIPPVDSITEKPIIDPTGNGNPSVDRLGALRQQFQGEDGQVAQRQLTAQAKDSVCGTAAIAAVPTGNRGGGAGDASSRATSSSATSAQAGCNQSSDDSQILQLLEETPGSSQTKQLELDRLPQNLKADPHSTPTH